MKTIWLVVPCYNEEEVLPETSKQLKNVMSSMIENGKISPESKIAFVNDGSKDNTWNIISTLCTGDGIFAGINLSRNKGHQNALLAGLMTAKKYADAVISLDADLQDDVNAIEKMVDNFIAGDDIVYGVRSSRKTDTFFKRFTAEGFYKFMAAMGVEIVFNHADYRLMSRRALDALRVPVVVLGQDMEGYSSVFNDDYRSMLQLCRKVRPNSVHPAYIGVTQEDVSAGQERRRGFLDACAELGLDVPADAMGTSPFSLDGGYECAESLMSRHPELDTFVCATDVIAFGALTCAREYGRRVPEDVQVTGVGDSDLTRVVTPSLTSIHHHYQTSGREAAKLLIEAMTSKDVVPREIRMSYGIMMRNSTR